MLTPEYLQEITDKSESLAAGLKRIYHKTDCAEYYGTLADEERNLSFPRQICGIYKRCRSLTNFGGYYERDKKTDSRK